MLGNDEFSHLTINLIIILTTVLIILGRKVLMNYLENS